MSLPWWSVPVHNLCHADTYTLHRHISQYLRNLETWARFGGNLEIILFFSCILVYCHLGGLGVRPMTRTVWHYGSVNHQNHINFHPVFLSEDFDSFSLSISRIYEFVLIWPMMWRGKFSTFLINLAFILCGKHLSFSTENGILSKFDRLFYHY